MSSPTVPGPEALQPFLPPAPNPAGSDGTQGANEYSRESNKPQSMLC